MPATLNRLDHIERSWRTFKRTTSVDSLAFAQVADGILGRIRRATRLARRLQVPMHFRISNSEIGPLLEDQEDCFYRSVTGTSYTACTNNYYIREHVLLLGTLS